MSYLKKVLKDDHHKQKIVLVCNTSWGMMMFRKNLMTEMLRQGYKVVVLTPTDDESDELKKLGVKHIHLPIDNQGSNPFKDIFIIYRLYKHYKAIKPDLVFNYTVKPNIYGSFAARFSKTRSIAVITGLGYTFINDNLTAKVARNLYKYALKYALKVWFINYDDRNKFIKHKLVKRELIHMLPSEGVDMQKYIPIKNVAKNKKFTFTLIARLLWDKGIGELIDAIRILKRNGVEFDVLLVGFVGYDNPKAITIDQVRSWEEEGLVKYMGPTKDVPSFIAKADCIVLPSYREGISKILLESASMAKPIIATNVPGCRDIVEHTVSGYLCRVKDAKDLAAKMYKMINLSSEALETMGENGRAFVHKNFDENLVIENYIKIMDNYCKTSSNRKYKLKS